MGKKRKTREQKIISDLRRKLTLQEASLPEKRTSTSPPLQQVEPTFSTPATPPEKAVLTYQPGDYSYLVKDLRKVALLTGLAILVQGVLYLALR